MEIFVLTCVNEHYEVVSVNAFDSIKNAQNAMIVSYQRELDIALEEYDDEDIEENSIDETSACIVVDENFYAYYWEITKTKLE